MRRSNTGLVWVSALIATVAGAVSLACAPARASLGNFNLRRYENAADSPTTYGVQEGRLLSGTVDVAIDADGCARGEVAPGAMVVLCPKKVSGEPQEKGGQLVRWTGIGGDFVTEVSADGKELRVDGQLTSLRRRRQASATLQVHATLLYGDGPQWDELRSHPVLLAVAAAVTGVQGVPSEVEKKAVEDLSR